MKVMPKALNQKNLYYALFLTLLLSISITTGILWHLDNQGSQKTLKQLLLEQDYSTYINKLQQIERNRLESVVRMSLLEDPFDLYDEILNHQKLGGEFITFRAKYRARENSPLTESLSLDEKFHWSRLRGLLIKAGVLQHKMIDRAEKRNMSEVKRILVAEILPHQRKVVSELNWFANNQKIRTERTTLAVMSTKQHQAAMVFLVLILAAVVVFVLVTQIARVNTLERERERQLQRINTIRNIETKSNLPVSNVIDALLAFLVEQLSASKAAISRVSNETNTDAAVYQRGYKNTTNSNKILNQSIVTNALVSDSLYVVKNTDQLNDEDRKRYKQGEKAYIGKPLGTEGIEYGVLSVYFDKELRDDVNSDDQGLINMVSDSIARLIYRENIESREQKQQDFIDKIESQLKFIKTIECKIRPLVSSTPGAIARITEENASDKTNANVSENLRALKEACGSLQNSINEIETSTERQSSNQEEIVNIHDIVPIVEEVKLCLVNENALPSDAIEIETENPTHLIKCNIINMRVALFNMMNNAVSHSRTNTAKIKIATINKNLVKLTIVDDGPGFSQHVLKTFYMEDNEDIEVIEENMMAIGGVGLSVTRDYILQMGGKLHIANDPDAGGLVEITIQAA